MKNITILSDATIQEAMIRLDKTAEKCLLVVDANEILLGTITDGDIRRAILDLNPISSQVGSICNKNPVVIEESNLGVNSIKEKFLDNKIELIPVVNDLHQIVGYKTWTEVFGAEFPDRSQKINAPVVIMAGGKGTRLKPFTDVLPKPLIPVNDIPVVEHIIEKFTNIGCSSIYLTVNYKAKILKAYFEELSPKYKVTFIDEPEPLGTAGSLNFLSDHFNQPIFVTNCDIIIKSDYREIYKYHESNSYDITVVASIKNYVIPYGTCELNDDGSLNCINEKPKYEFLINTGLYVVNPEILSLIPKNRFFHFTHLITKATSIGKRVGVFPVNENSWIDIGQWKEYRKAGELL